LRERDEASTTVDNHCDSPARLEAITRRGARSANALAVEKFKARQAPRGHDPAANATGSRAILRAEQAAANEATSSGDPSL